MQLGRMWLRRIWLILALISLAVAIASLLTILRYKFEKNLVLIPRVCRVENPKDPPLILPGVCPVENPKDSPAILSEDGYMENPKDFLTQLFLTQLLVFWFGLMLEAGTLGMYFYQPKPKRKRVPWTLKQFGMSIILPVVATLISNKFDKFEDLCALLALEGIACYCFFTLLLLGFLEDYGLIDGVLAIALSVATHLQKEGRLISLLVCMLPSAAKYLLPPLYSHMMEWFYEQRNMSGRPRTFGIEEVRNGGSRREMEEVRNGGSRREMEEVGGK